MTRIISEELSPIILVVAILLLFQHVWACCFYGARFIPTFNWSRATEIISDKDGEDLLNKFPKHCIELVKPDFDKTLEYSSPVQLEHGEILVLAPKSDVKAPAVNLRIISKGGKKASTGPTLPGHTNDFEAVRLLDGTILLLSDSGQGYVFVPRLNKVRSVGSMLMPRKYSAMACLSNGQVLACGGEVEKSRSDSGRSATTTMEIYDSKSERFHFAGHMHQGRIYPEIRTLNDGKALIFGGEKDEYIRHFADAQVPYELYSPH